MDSPSFPRSKPKIKPKTLNPLPFFGLASSTLSFVERLRLLVSGLLTLFLLSLGSKAIQLPFLPSLTLFDSLPQYFLIQLFRSILPSLYLFIHCNQRLSMNESLFTNLTPLPTGLVVSLLSLPVEWFHSSPYRSSGFTPLPTGRVVSLLSLYLLSRSFTPLLER